VPCGGAQPTNNDFLLTYRKDQVIVAGGIPRRKRWRDQFKAPVVSRTWNGGVSDHIPVLTTVWLTMDLIEGESVNTRKAPASSLLYPLARHDTQEKLDLHTIVLEDKLTKQIELMDEEAETMIAMPTEGTDRQAFCLAMDIVGVLLGEVYGAAVVISEEELATRPSGIKPPRHNGSIWLSKTEKKARKATMRLSGKAMGPRPTLLSYLRRPMRKDSVLRASRAHLGMPTGVIKGRRFGRRMILTKSIGVDWWEKRLSGAGRRKRTYWMSLGK
jgi:hypothetical protein